MLNQKNNQTWRAGFTLIEIVLTLAIITAVALIAIPVYGQLQFTNDLDTTLSLTVHTLRRAQTLSMAVEHDSNWGVHLETGSLTLYAINNNGDHLADTDEVFSISDSIVITGQNTFVFTKLTGKPMAAGTIVLTNPRNDTSKTITINETGVANY